MLDLRQEFMGFWLLKFGSAVYTEDASLLIVNLTHENRVANLTCQDLVDVVLFLDNSEMFTTETLLRGLKLNNEPVTNVDVQFDKSVVVITLPAPQPLNIVTSLETELRRCSVNRFDFQVEVTANLGKG